MFEKLKKKLINKTFVSLLCVTWVQTQKGEEINKKSVMLICAPKIRYMFKVSKNRNFALNNF
jgi:hypothetical protein